MLVTVSLDGAKFPPFDAITVMALPDRTVYSITGASLNRDWPAKSAGVVAALQLQQKFGPGQRSLRPALCDYVSHFHAERNHQGEDNVILFPEPADRVGETAGEIRTRERLAACSDSKLLSRARRRRMSF